MPAPRSLTRRLRPVTCVATLTLTAGLAAAAGLPAAGQARTHAEASGASFSSRVFAEGSKIMHAGAGAGGASEQVSDPDDITTLGGRIFVAFQNGVGPQGEASSTKNRASTIVEFTTAGHEVGQWDVTGKIDGLTADPALSKVIATVDEDAHSSLYLLNPAGTGTITHFRYATALPSKGGTDAIAIDKGKILISASAPGTTGRAAPQASYPAVYVATLKPATKTVELKMLFSDEATATVANRGKTGTATLALTDPDSNAMVPVYASRFGGDFELTSQGDEEQIFVSGAGGSSQKLDVLKLKGSFDDSVWPSNAEGTLYVTDNASDQIFAVTGPFTRGEEVAAETPCGANGSPSVCPAKNYPDNYLATIDPETGSSAPVKVSGPRPAAQGLLFIP